MKVIFSIIISMEMENTLLEMEMLISENIIKTKNKVLVGYKINFVKFFTRVNGRMEFLLKTTSVNCKEYFLKKHLK
jgi:hypothetical protein